MTPLGLRSLIVAAVVLVACWTPWLWRVCHHAVTLVHEGSHVLVGLLSGRSVEAVRLHRDHSGVTVTRGRAGGFGVLATYFAGYPGPAVLGVMLAWGAWRGRPGPVLIGLAVAIAALLLCIRTWHGLLVVVLAAGALGALARWGTAYGRLVAVHAMAWFLLIAAPRSLYALQGARRRGLAAGSDPDRLAAVTHVPAAAWLLLMGVVMALCLYAGARLLLQS